MLVLDIIFGVLNHMSGEILLFKPLKGRHVWMAPVIYINTVILFAGPLLSKLGMFSYIV